jgi:hypothetical protein
MFFFWVKIGHAAGRLFVNLRRLRSPSGDYLDAPAWLSGSDFLKFWNLLLIDHMMMKRKKILRIRGFKILIIFLNFH